MDPLDQSPVDQSGPRPQQSKTLSQNTVHAIYGKALVSTALFSPEGCHLCEHQEHQAVPFICIHIEKIDSRVTLKFKGLFIANIL